MTGPRSLPQGFEILEPFVELWSAASLSARDTRRLDSTESERLAFYAAAKDLVAEAMDHLDSKGLDSFDDKDERLMNLMLSLVHVSLAVEVQHDGEPIHAAGARRLPITRGHADHAD
jgi:hypothetical protein